MYPLGGGGLLVCFLLGKKSNNAAKLCILSSIILEKHIYAYKCNIAFGVNSVT